MQPIHTVLRLVAFSLFVASLAVHPAFAQQQATKPVIVVAAPGQTQRITLRDGSQLVGRVLSVDSTSVRFESTLGVTTLAVDSILDVRTERPGRVVDGRYYFKNPNTTRLIFAPTGRTLPKGEGYINDFWIFLPGFAVGLSDRVTIGGGMSIVPGAEWNDQVIFATPKVGIVRGDDFNASLGALALAVPNFDDGRESVGILYGVGTWGREDASFTAGVGYGYVGGTLAGRPAILLGADARMAPRVAFVTENYVFPQSGGLVSAAIRFMGEGMAVDLGYATLPGVGDSTPFPVMNFMWKW
ncbi:MAG TPA: hypothetical protein VFT29_14060 [Gemmatimonadaceae bacterium]|nr:hypothetical protein [Gemmatimonadaceae bacterium]